MVEKNSDIFTAPYFKTKFEFKKDERPSIEAIAAKNRGKCGNLLQIFLVKLQTTLFDPLLLVAERRLVII